MCFPFYNDKVSGCHVEPKAVSQKIFSNNMEKQTKKLCQCGSCYSIVIFVCMFCRSLFVLLPFLFWPLYCLFFFNLRILITSLWFLQALLQTVMVTGADPGFQVRGAHLKKLRRAEGGAKIFGVFRVKNHNFTQKNHIFSNFRGGARPLDPPLGQYFHQS